MNSNINYKIKKNAIVRFVCNGLAFIMLILAYLGFSWGEYLSPVQKSGVAVSFSPESRFAILPTSVFIPVAVTTATHVP